MADDVRTLANTRNTGRGDDEVIALWPEGAPDPLPNVGPEAVFRQIAGNGPTTDMLRNVSQPTLTVFRADPAKANGAGVIVCPGGGWQILAWEHEGLDMARWFAARGVTAFVLKYRVMATPDDPAKFAERNAAGNARQAELAKLSGRTAPRALSDLVKDEIFVRARAAAAADGRRALALVCERAAEFGLKGDRIGMVGFSAGAFLTADVAVEPGGAPLAFAAPIYGGETSGRPVPADAPPLFTCIAQDDRMLFKVVEGLYADWSNADRPAELHIFPRGGHGFGMVPQNKPIDRWLGLMEDWLADLGYLTS
ncbi:MAG: dienelactone hydrolase family protein [Proteobacteria bacterium]|nr:dienelactone hydrolase family protein [Pseudomonadota bacterium]